MTKRGPGRPAGTTKPFLSDPDRYAIALVDMFQAFGVTQNKALLLVTGVMFGRAVEPSAKFRVLQRVEGWEAFGFETQNVTIVGRSSTLRHKSSRARSAEEIHWRAAMSSALAIAFAFSGIEQKQRVALVRTACKVIGEEPFAERVLIPMLKLGDGNLN